MTAACPPSAAPLRTRSPVECPVAEFAAVQVAGLLPTYRQRYASDAWIPCEIGGRFNVPLTNPDTSRPSRTFNHAGAYAGIVEVDGRRWLLQQRTTSQEIAGPEAPFWHSLDFDAQSAGSLLAYDQTGEPLAGVAYDVVRRPEIRPRLVPKGSARRSTEENWGTITEIEHGTYCGRPLPEPASDLITSAGRESLALFRLRLAADALLRPDWYFQRRLQPRNNEQLRRQARDLWQTAGAIRLARRDGQHYRNPAACWNYRHACEFLDLCSGPEQPRASSKSETAAIEGRESAGQQTLTHSRARCFQLCRRKHFYRYELGLRGSAPQSSAWHFARLMHLALEGWWRARLEAVHEHPLARI